MGLKKEIEKTKLIIEAIREMFDNHDKMIQNLHKMNNYLQKQIDTQEKRFDLIIDKLKELSNKDKDEKN